MTTPRSQSALAADANFQKRLASLLLSEALVIAAEDAGVPFHLQRRAFAQQVIANPVFSSQNYAYAICNSTNLVAATTSYNFDAFAVETSATDAEITSQIGAIWNTLAGV